MEFFFLSRITQKKKHYILILCLLFVSCLTHEEDTGAVIKIDIDKTSDVGKMNHTLAKIQVVPMETTTESLFGEVARIEYYQGKIFILDIINAKSLFVFSEQGKFLGKTKFGKGPGEMINPFAFCIDKVKNTLLIWDQTLKTLFTLDLELNPISKQELDLFITDINKKADGNYIIHSQNPEKDAYTFNLFSAGFEKLLASVDFSYKFAGGAMYLSRAINVSNRSLLITPNDYHIYQLDDSHIKPIYRIDFGTKAFGRKMLDERGASEMWPLVRNSKNVSFPVAVFESKNFAGFQVMYGRDSYTYLISNSDGSTLSVNDMISSNALPKCTIKGAIGPDDNILYGLIDPDELIEYFEKESGENRLNIRKPNLDDNPALIFIGIK